MIFIMHWKIVDKVQGKVKFVIYKNNLIKLICNIVNNTQRKYYNFTYYGNTKSITIFLKS